MVKVGAMRAANSHPRSDKGVAKFSDQEIVKRNSLPEPNSGCWLWTGSVNSWGYGRLGRQRIERQAHRLSYAAFNGQIRTDFLVLHRCDVPCCVNPKHLFLGTDADNMKDMQAKGRTRGNAGNQGEMNAMAKLTYEAVAQIRSSNKSISELARKFGVSRRAIRFALQEKTWAIPK